MRRLLIMILALALTFALSGCCAFIPKERISQNDKVTEHVQSVEEIEESEIESEEDDYIENVEYQIIKQDNSYRNINGEVLIENYYDQVILKGDSESISLINSAICDDMYENLFNHEDIKTDAQYATPEYPFCSNYTAEVTHNADGYISIKMYTEWYMGGVFNSIWYGMTFDLNTGRAATLAELTGIDAKTLESRLKEKTWSYLTSEMLEALFEDAYDTLQDYTLDEFNYCLQNGEIVLLFPVYTFAPGVAGSTQVPTGIYIEGF